MTVFELHQKLLGYIEALSNSGYKDGDSVVAHDNTYWVKSDEYLSIPGVGFICLDEVEVDGRDSGGDDDGTVEF